MFRTTKRTFQSTKRTFQTMKHTFHTMKYKIALREKKKTLGEKNKFPYVLVILSLLKSQKTMQQILSMKWGKSDESANIVTKCVKCKFFVN